VGPVGLEPTTQGLLLTSFWEFLVTRNPLPRLGSGTFLFPQNLYYLLHLCGILAES